jgi:hypothetical protein
MGGPRNERRSPRFATSLPTRWRYSLTTGVVATDASREGLFLRSTYTASLGSLLQLEVELPTGIVELVVLVRFIGETNRGAGMGVEILQAVTEIGRARWINYCEDHSRLE